MGFLAIFTARGCRCVFVSNLRAVPHQKFYFSKGNHQKKYMETLIRFGLTAKSLSHIYSLEDIID